MKDNQILDVLNNWAAALNAADYSAVIAMYDPSATLLPTFSSQTCRTPAAIQGYFEAVAENDQVTVSYDKQSIQIDAMGTDFHLATGIYHWNIVKSETVKKVQARFSFVINHDNRAPILHQHSSVVPE